MEHSTSQPISPLSPGPRSSPDGGIGPLSPGPISAAPAEKAPLIEPPKLLGVAALPLQDSPSSDGLHTGSNIEEGKPRTVPQHTSPGDQTHGVYPKAPVLMVLSFLLGVFASLGHHLLYSHFNSAIVDSNWQQEWNIRVGSVIAQVVSLSLTASVWFAYTQWLWMTIRRKAVSIQAMNAAFGVQTSLIAFTNIEMIFKMKLGSVLALVAWFLQIPPLFTPATLSVVSSTTSVNLQANVPSLDFTNPSKKKFFAYYTPSNKTYPNASPDSYILDGPRTILTRLTTATAASGEILSITPPASNSSYSIQFDGPYVSCNTGNSTMAGVTDALLKQKSPALQKDSLNETFAYYAFVPSFGNYDGFNGLTFNGTNFTALDEPRLQEKPMNATNELWMKFYRYLRDMDGNLILDAQHQRIVEPQYVVCNLWNASYHLNFSFINGTQNVTNNSITLVNKVQYPNIEPSEASNLVQLSYSAFFWALCDQVVGSIGLLSNTKNATPIPTYGSISTNIEHTSLLGSNDLDYFFDLNSEVLNVSNTVLSPPRRADKALAQNQTLPALIEQLSFNMTVGLLNEPLLTTPIQATTIQSSLVNRYFYNEQNLWTAYGVAVAFTSLALISGFIAFSSNGGSYDNDFSTILSISRDPDLAELFPVCCHGKLPLPEATLKAKLNIEKMKDGGQSLRWKGQHKPVCKVCEREANEMREQPQRRRGSSTWTFKWPRTRVSEVSQ